jgi:hypothetical protein
LASSYTGLQYFSFLNLSNTHLANNNDRVEFMQSSSSGVEILEAEEEDWMWAIRWTCPKSWKGVSTQKK